jgi:hypothetical protein
MDESFLLKVALGGAILGLVVLFSLVHIIEVNDTTISRIDGSDLVSGQGNRIIGKVSSVKRLENSVLVSVRYESVKDAIAFQNDIDIRVNDTVEMSGKQDDGLLIIDRLKVLDR